MNYSEPKTDKFIKKVLNKMFKTVGFDKFELEFTKQKDWFQKKTWTEAQQNEFRDWFVAQARKDLKMSKRYAESEFSWFNLMYGWSVKD